jgi:hypothetical protein
LPLYPRELGPSHPLDRRLSRSHIRSGCCGGVNILQEYKNDLLQKLELFQTINSSYCIS